MLSLIAIAIGYVFSLKITKPINEITELVNRTANLDLKYDTSYEKLYKSKDEVGIIFHSIADMRENLRRMVEELNAVSKESAEKLQEIVAKFKL